MTNDIVPREEEFADRVKEALRGAGLTISALAKEWGVDRSALNTRITQDRMGEEELDRLAALVRRSKAWLRYGVEGDFVDGVRWAAARIREEAERIVLAAVRGELEVHGPLPSEPLEKWEGREKKRRPRER